MQLHAQQTTQCCMTLQYIASHYITLDYITPLDITLQHACYTKVNSALPHMQVALPPEIRQFVHASTGNYGKVKLVLQKNAFFVESPFPDVLHTLLQVSYDHH